MTFLYKSMFGKGSVPAGFEAYAEVLPASEAAGDEMPGEDVSEEGLDGTAPAEGGMPAEGVEEPAAADGDAPAAGEGEAPAAEEGAENEA